MRYQHQGYQLAVDCPADLSDDGKPALKAAFDAAHKRVYGASAPGEDAEVVTFRVIAEIEVPKLAVPEIEGGGDAADALVGTRPLYDPDRKEFADANIYDRARLRAGNTFTGPAIVQQFDSTTVVLAAMTCTVDPCGNLIIETGAGA